VGTSLGIERRHNQKRRKDFIIVSLGMSVALLERIDRAVMEQNENTRAAPLDRSSWLRRAIERDLDHVKRSRRRLEDVPAEAAADVLAAKRIIDTMQALTL
jgi:hypothetical protein